MGEVRQAVGADVFADLLHGAGVADQFLAARHVNPHETRMAHWRRADTHMHFGRAALAQEPHQRAGRGAAHDTVVHQHNPLALQVSPQRVVLQMHAGSPQAIIGLDESAADVAVLGQAFGVGEARRDCIANRRGRRRVGHAHHDVGIGRRFACQRFA